MTALAVLNPAAQVALADCELRIERGLKTFIDVGQALADIRDNRLYKGTHGTFEDYCRDRWKMSDGRARQFMIAAETATNVAVAGLPAPTNEGQARALAAVPEPERAEVWRETVTRTNGKPTAAAVRAVQNERTQAPGPDGAVTAPPAGPGIEPERRQGVMPDPQQVEAERMETQRVQILDRARRRAPRLVPEIRDLINEVVAGINLGEAGLVTPRTVAEIRALVDILEARMEAQQ
jgi:hypothetical protein